MALSVNDEGMLFNTMLPPSCLPTGCLCGHFLRAPHACKNRAAGNEVLFPHLCPAGLSQLALIIHIQQTLTFTSSLAQEKTQSVQKKKKRRTEILKAMEKRPNP